jgi:hypothetical protein
MDDNYSLEVESDGNITFVSADLQMRFRNEEDLSDYLEKRKEKKRIFREMHGVAKYSKDAPFEDPVVRCDSCQRLLLVSKLKEFGACLCGNTKVRNVRGFNDAEQAKMEEWGVDPAFLKLFEPVDAEGMGA